MKYRKRQCHHKWERPLRPWFAVLQAGFALYLTGMVLTGSHLYATEPSADLLLLQPQDAYVQNEVLVILKDDVDPEAFNDHSMRTKGLGGKILRKIALARSGKSLVRIKLDENKTVGQTLTENWMAKDPRILRVEPNYRVYALQLPNDPYLSHLWGLYNHGQTGGTAASDINMPQAWDITTGSADIAVAVIDTGIDYTHPDLANRIWINTKEIAGNGVDDDNNGYVDDVRGYDFVENDADPFDENGHGTHCAGTIGAEGDNNVGVAGINWNCKVMACRFLDADGSGTVTDAIEAINYAVANGARVLNNSWGGTGYSAALLNAIENAESQGVLFVAAAGNDGTDNDSTPQYPASYPCSNIISVAATDHQDRIADFSCYGQNSVDIAAPGVSILSTVPGGYSWYSGTSMATPHVSGAAALLLALDPDMTLLELKSRLLGSGDLIEGLEAITITGRRLNAYNALSAASGFTFANPTVDSLWVTGATYSIRWTAIGTDSVVRLSLRKNGAVIATIAEDIANTGSYAWHIPEDLSYGTDYSILLEDGSVSQISDTFTITDERIDYFTESFLDAENQFDLSNHSMFFVPDGAGSYEGLAYAVTSLPTSPAGGILLRLRDDDSIRVELTGGTVELFGTAYDHFYVGSNGYITLGEADQEYRVELPRHFEKKRIAVFYKDLNPSAGGRISVKELTDRAVITWEEVPEFNRLIFHTFQAELFFNGKIRLSWLDNAQRSCIVGLSRGSGLSEDFLSSDISGYSSYTPQLRFVQVNGPEKTAENNSLQLQCTGYFEDQIIQDITESEDIVWAVDSGTGVIDAIGNLDVGDIQIFQHIQLTAESQGKTDTYGVYAKGDTINDIQVSRCSLRAGRRANTDSIDLTGIIPLSEIVLLTAETLDIKIWSNRNACIHQVLFENPSDYVNRQGVFSGRQNTATSTGFGTQTLRIDPQRNLFRLSVRNVDLTGISCPFYITIACGAQTYAGQVAQTAVNNGRSVPVELLNGVENKLVIDRIMLRSRPGIGGSVTAQGQFSLGDQMPPIDSLLFHFNADTCTGHLVQSSRSFDLYESDDGSFSARMYFDRGKFTLKADGVDVNAGFDLASVGLTFGSFDESLKIDL